MRRETQPSKDSVRDSILEDEALTYGLLESVCPQLVSCGGVDQSHIHPDAIPGLLHIPFHDAVDVQFSAEVLGRFRCPPERHDRSVRDHPEGSDAAEVGRKRLRKPIGVPRV